MTTEINSSTLIYDMSTRALISASAAFKNKNIQQGFKDFKLVYQTIEHEVYKQLWEIKGKPQGNLEYGRHAFHDVNGLCSTAFEKAQAIDQYLLSRQAINEHRPRNDVRLTAGDIYSYEWRYDFSRKEYRYERVTDWDRWGREMEEIVPKDCGELGQKIGIATVGTIGAAYLLIHVCELISALRK